MELTGNTILITGGGSGIGRGLAESFQALGNQVVIAGRRKSALDETIAANPGMQAMELDVDDSASLKQFVTEIAQKHPKLNVLINNAGIMRPENLLQKQEDLSIAEKTIATNLLGPIRLTAALLPGLLQQPRATIMTVTSGLAYVPLAFTPTYCATKAAIHSYTVSLRYQLKNSNIDVLELAPPYVQTDLMDGKNDPRAMPLKDFIAEVMEILKTQPDAKEILVKNVHPLRFAEQRGSFDQVFEGFNDAMAGRFQ